MKTIVLIAVFSLSGVSLLAQDSAVKDWEKRVVECNKIVIDVKTADIEKERPIVLKIISDFLRTCVFSSGSLREQTNNLVTRGLITEERAKKVSIEVITPAEQLLPRLEGALRRARAKQ